MKENTTHNVRIQHWLMGETMPLVQVNGVAIVLSSDAACL